MYLTLKTILGVDVPNYVPIRIAGGFLLGVLVTSLVLYLRWKKRMISRKEISTRFDRNDTADEETLLEDMDTIGDLADHLYRNENVGEDHEAGHVLTRFKEELEDPYSDLRITRGGTPGAAGGSRDEPTGAGEHPLVREARNLRALEDARAPLAKDLLGRLADDGPDGEYGDLLKEIVTSLDEAHSVAEAVDPLAKARNRGGFDTALAECRRDLQEWDGRALGSRVADLVDMLEEIQASKGALDDLSELAGDIQDRQAPSSRLAQDLLVTLHDAREHSEGAGSSGRRTREVLEEVVDALEASKKYRRIRDRIEVRGFRDRLDELRSDLRRPGASVEEAVADRLDDLEDQVDDHEETGAALALHEVEFLEDALVPAIREARTGAGGDGVREDLDQLRDRHADLVPSYRDKHPGWNHQIPSHFDEMVEDLVGAAEDAAVHEETERAAALVEAGEMGLDRVEALYGENRFNVLLRNLGSSS